MFPRILLILLSLASAQGQAPAEVDQTLRSRVNEFFRYHVDGGASLRRAMDMVAEDTKDIYFASGKPQVLKYEIAGIEYFENFTRATATVKVSRNYTIAGQVMELTQPLPTSWKVEDGKWMWYVDPGTQGGTPMAQLAQEQAAAGAAPAVAPPPDLAKPEVVAALAQSILRSTGSLDKQNVTFRWGQASEDQVVFVNGYPAVELELGWVPEIPGLSVTLDKATLSSGENGVVRFRYAPPEGLDGARQRSTSFTVQLTVVPFNQVLGIRVGFTTPNDPVRN